LKSARI